MPEVRNQKEGSLVWVQASASALPGWTTGSAPTSGFFGYVRDFQITSGRGLYVVSERGIPNHQKVTMENAPQVTLSMDWTAYIPPFATAAGGTVPEVHLEWKQKQPELGGGWTGQYMQLYRVAVSQLQITEGVEANRLQMTLQPLGMLLTGSGYMANHV